MAVRLLIVPAYGRDYKSKKALLDDWKASKDFIIQDIHSRDNGRYVNRQDVENEDYIIEARYKKLMSLTMIYGVVGKEPIAK